MRAQHFAMAVLLAAVWGLNFIIIKIGLQDLPPITFCCIRLFLVSIPAVLFIKRPNASYQVIAGYGMLVFALQFAFLFLGIYLGVSSWLAAVLFQTQVFFSIILAVILLREQVNSRQIMGAVIAFTGVLLVAFNFGGDVSFVGFLAILAGAISCAFGNLVSKKLSHVKDIIALIVWAGFFAWPALLLCALYFEGGDAIIDSLQAWNWNTSVALAYTVFIATFLGFYLWNWLLFAYPVSTVAPFMLLVPIFSMGFAILFLDEEVYLWKIGATSLVVLGLCLNSSTAKKFTDASHPSLLPSRE